jgi:hypothetical protein
MTMMMTLADQHALTSLILASTFIGLMALWIALGKIVADELKQQ